jgi:arylsulfatase A
MAMNRRQFMQRSIASGAAFSLAGCLAGGATGKEGKAIRQPNFIIILADDMGYGDSSVYDGWIKTPHMEKLAAEGLTFTDFHSSGAVCSPTRAGLMTGRYQERAGVPWVINADPQHPSHQWGLDPKEVTFPKLLKQRGYTTGIFGKWHLGYDKKFNPVRHGFDRFRGYVSGNIDYISHYDRMGVHDWWDGLEQVAEDGYTTHLITQHTVDFIKDNKDNPFCVYVAHEAVHTPFQAPDDAAQRGPAAKPGGPKRDPKDTYDQMMLAMDEGIGQVVQAVKDNGLAENTLIFFFSDNGATRVGSNAPCRGHKGTQWEGGHRVPAIAWWPGMIAAGKKTDQTAISLDLMPTMLDLAGAEGPAGHQFDGESLRSTLLDGGKPVDRQLFWKGQAMRDGKWKLMIDRKTPRLYDLSTDIGEQTDLASEHPERVKTMLAALEAWKRDVGHRGD